MYQLKHSLEDRVIVLDDRGNHLTRGRILGRVPGKEGGEYDVQPDGEPSLSSRVRNVPEARIRQSGRPSLVKGGSA